MKNVSLNLLIALIMTLGFQTPNAQPRYTDHILGGMTCVIVQHTVADYDKWYAGYMKDEDRRKNAGIFEKLLFKGVKNNNMITAVFELEDLDKAKAFFNNPASAELMQAAGVTSKPSLTYFKVKNSSLPQGKCFMTVSHDIQDYDLWKEKFDAHQKVRTAYGISVTAVGKNLDNPNAVVAIFNSTSPDNFISFLEESDLKEAMEDAGLTSEPVIEIGALSAN